MMVELAGHSLVPFLEPYLSECIGYSREKETCNIRSRRHQSGAKSYRAIRNDMYGSSTHRCTVQKWHVPDIQHASWRLGKVRTRYASNKSTVMLVLFTDENFGERVRTVLGSLAVLNPGVTGLLRARSVSRSRRAWPCGALVVPQSRR